jgi:ligand-binding sensor domain-containing protein
MPPFNNDWCNSLFLSQDQVALESVCYDFLRTEWNGTYSHNPANNSMEDMVNVNGVDDYLHQAADSSNWPEGIRYDPDNSGIAMASLGVHEHWNNAAKKQYSRNLGRSRGIELISVPDSLVGGRGPEISSSEQWLETTPTIQADPDRGKENEQAEQESLTSRWEARPLEVVSTQVLSFDGTIQAENFYSAVVDENNTKWFLSDAGILSFDGVEWNTHNSNRKIPARDLKSMAFDSSEFGMELWFASPMGATVTEIPVDANSGATTYYEDNSDILSENVFSVTVGKGSLRWFGTEKGISAFLEDRWLPPVYQRKYPEYMFKDFPITALATNPGGDSLYIGTKGAGVGRVYRNDVDAISGASEYAQWGPILMPSNNVSCIYIAPDGTQWFGTDAGVARHRGNSTMENWKVFIVGNGLIHNEVQSIAGDLEGNVWIGTRGGVSIIGNRSLRTLTVQEGLPSNNVLSIAVDKEGLVWLGTDAGVASYSQGELSTYKKQ